MQLKNLLFTAIISVPFAASAQTVIDLSVNPYSKVTDDEFELTFPAKPGYTKTIVNGNVIYTAPAIQKADAVSHNVTFTYDYKTNEATPLTLTIFSKEYGTKVVDQSGKNASFTFAVPAGTYDMLAVYKGKPTGTYAVFKENVTVSADTTLVFKKEDADQTYRFTGHNIKGETIELDRYESGKVAEPGNVNTSSFRSYTFFTIEGMGVVHTIVGGSYRIKGYDIDLYANKTSDRIHVLHHANVRDLDNITYLFKYETPLTGSKDLNSDPKNLKLYEQKFCPSADGTAENHTWGIRVWVAYDGGVLLSGKAENKKLVLTDSINRFYVDLPESADKKGFAVTASPMIADIVNESKQCRYIVGMPVTGNAAQGLRNVVYGSEQTFDGYLIPEGGGVAQVYPGHPRFSFTDKFSYTFGNSCPVLSIKSKDYGTTSSKLLSYIGRYGEIYETGIDFGDRASEADGDFTKYTFTFDHVNVDNVKGRNLTVLRYHTTGEDISAPSLQMLRFVNKEDRITDRFDNIGDATLEFAASDFQYHHDTKVAANRFYEHKPLKSVEVVCAPHGTEDWQTITPAEDPELFCMPVYGYFFKASLKDVKVAQDGWFDLKVILTDQAGNTNTQSIMPAFYSKKSSSGIKDVENANNSISYANGIISVAAFSQISIYSIDGKCVASVYGESVSTESLANGLYIAKAVDAAGNVSTIKFVK